MNVNKFLGFIGFLIFAFPINGQQLPDINHSIRISSSFDDTGHLMIQWFPKESATSYTIAYRYSLDDPFTFVPTPTPDTFFVFDDVFDDTRKVEVRVLSLGGLPATGYIMVGKEYIDPDPERSILILADANFQEDDEMVGILSTYIQVLENEMWNTRLEYINIDMSVTEVKQIILDDYAERGISSVLLVGHIPVPYSGNAGIDGHSNHIGAWVCDGFYGDIDGIWTDQVVNNTSAARPENHNIPGDGKYDQSIFPSKVEISIGRIDFSRLPVFDASETELLKAYFDKNIHYRLGDIITVRRGLIDNNFGLPEGFGSGAIRSFSGFFPVDSVHYQDYAVLKSKPYLWSFGAGGGNYTSANGIVNSQGFASGDYLSVFTTIFGSYFGDWDVENNLLRASLGSGSILVNAWSGRPIWHFHPLSVGATFGDIVTLVQNSNYASQFGNRATHISLLGDPTLRMYYPPRITSFTGDFLQDSIVFSWDGVPDVDGYIIYESVDGNGYNPIHQGVIHDTTFVYLCPGEGDEVTYFIRPARLEVSPSGSYYSLGGGKSVTIDGVYSQEVTAEFSISPDGGTVNTSTGATHYFWDFGDGFTSTDQNPVHEYNQAGDFLITLIASNVCHSDTVSVWVSITGTAEVGENISAWRLSPNPAKDILLISGAPIGMSFEIFDMAGKRVLRGTVKMRHQQIPVMKLGRGLYILNIGDRSLKFFKE